MENQLQRLIISKTLVVKKALEFLKQEMEYGDFGEFVSIDDNDLKKH